MKDENKTKKQLISELENLRRQTGQLEAPEAERKVMEEKPWGREEARSGVFNATPDLIAVTDKKGTIFDVNEAMAKRFGEHGEELTGSNGRGLVPQELARSENQYSEEVFRTGKPCRFEDENRVYPVVQEQGEIKRTAIHAIDITERKRAEDAVRESEEKYHNLVERFRDGICIIQNGIIQYANPASLDIIGYAPEEIMGTSMDAYIHPDNRDQVADFYRRRMAGEDVPLIYEAALLHKDGSKVDVELNAGITLYGDEPADFVVVHDITERKRMEQEIQQQNELLKAQNEELQINLEEIAKAKAYSEGLIKSMSEGLMVFDLEENVVDVNDALLEITGYRREEYVGRHITQTPGWPTDPEAAPKAMGRLRQQLAEEPRVTEMPAITKDGQQKILSVSHGVARNDDGTPMMFFVLIGDITERKQAEEALRESEERYRSLVSNLPDMVWTADSEWNLVFMSDNAQAVKGYTTEELSQRGMDFWAGTFHPDDFGQFDKAMKKLIKEGIPVNSEYRFRQKDGEWIWVNTRIIPVNKEDGTVVYQGITSDITERKQAEEAVRESEERYRSLVDNLPDLVWTSDFKADIVFANANSQAIVGYTTQELLQGGSGLWFENIYPDDLEPFKKKITKLIKEGIPVDFEYRFRKKDGEWIWTNTRIIPVHKENGTVFYQGITSDITERKQAEEQIIRRNRELSTLNEFTTLIPRSHDLNQTLHRSLAKVLDIMDMEIGFVAVVGERDGLVIKAEHGVSAEFERAITTIKLGEGLTGAIAQSGRPLFVEDMSNDPRVARRQIVKKEHLKTFAGVPLKARDKVLGVLGVMSRKQKQITSSDMQLLDTIGGYLGISIENASLFHQAAEVEALRRLNDFQSRLLSTVSHELRTPLTAIKGYASMLMDYHNRLGDDERTQCLESVDKATDRLADLIDELLDMSRLESGMLKITKSLTGLSQLLHETVAEARLRISDHHIALKPQEPLPSMRMDARRIRQVLDNLIDNAIKYSMPETEVVISASQAGGEVIISIADQGIGIAASELPKVFDRMYRVESKQSAKAGGLGLGLSICKGLVEAHGGRIWMESQEGKGTTCYFTLPIDTDGGSI